MLYHPFDVTAGGIPAQALVTRYTPSRQPVTQADPLSCDDGAGELSYKLLDRRGRPARWLDDRLNLTERAELDREVTNFLEGFA